MLLIKLYFRLVFIIEHIKWTTQFVHFTYESQYSTYLNINIGSMANTFTILVEMSY